MDTNNYARLTNMLKHRCSQLLRRLGILKTQRSAAGQQELDHEVRQMSLYCTPTCLFCLRVRFLIRKLSLKIQIKNVLTSMDAQRELLEQGGRSMVPCLCVQQSDGTRTWMYESADINHYLRQQFDPKSNNI